MYVPRASGDFPLDLQQKFALGPNQGALRQAFWTPRCQVERLLSSAPSRLLCCYMPMFQNKLSISCEPNGTRF